MTDEPRYAWVITRDLLNTKGDKHYSVGTAGPRTATDAELELARTSGRLFRLLDDDGIPYYHGKVWYGEDADEDDGNPLQDFGTPNDGATRLQYRNEHGQWEDAVG